MQGSTKGWIPGQFPNKASQRCGEVSQGGKGVDGTIHTEGEGDQILFVPDASRPEPRALFKTLTIF